MAWVNTGMQRRRTLTVDKKVDGVSIAGYPKEYNIQNAFSMNGNSYAILTGTELLQISVATYLARLADFKDYVEQAEFIADLDAITTEGFEPYVENTTACPIGE